MRSVFHFGLLLLVAAACAGVAQLGRQASRRPPESERWFIPGPLGWEPGGYRSSAIGDRLPAAGHRSSVVGSRGFRTRAFSGLNRPEAAEWGRRNGLGERLPFSHNLARVFPPELAKTHPELFPLENGRRLVPPPGSGFWNPDIARPDAALHAADTARRHFLRNPDAVSFALGVNDALIWGESPELLALVEPSSAKPAGAHAASATAWFRERPDYSNLVFTFMNRTASELSRTHPDKYVGALAYYWCENTPDFPLHPQVIPFLTADRSQGYDPAFWKEERELQDRWGKLAGSRSKDRVASTRDQWTKGPGGTVREGTTHGSGMLAPHPLLAADDGEARRLGIYDYLYGVGFLIPRIHTKLLAANLRNAREAGFTDYYAEIAPNWGLDPITPWLTAQLLQDPVQSETALLDEFYRRYFKEAAGPMRRFFEKCEEQWMNQPGPAYWLKHFRNESQAIVFRSAVCVELRRILTEAEESVRSAKVRARVKLVSETFGVTERFVRFKETRDALIRGSLSGAGEETRQTLESYLAARSEFIRYTVNLMRAEPLALARFGWDDYLKNDPVPMAERALHAGNPAPTRDNSQPTSGGVPPPTSGLMAELLRNPAMDGPLLPPRTIAGLTYSVDLPAEWTSRVEPAEHHFAKLVGGGKGRVLLIRGTKDTMISQWVPWRSDAAGKPAPLAMGTIGIRGRVSPGTAVSLIFAWLDADHRHVGFKTVRLPDGDWPDFVTLTQAGAAPPQAAWVGLGLRIQNQVAGDWVEAGEFSLRGN